MKNINIQILNPGSQSRAYGPNVAEAIISFEPYVALDDERQRKSALKYFKLNVCDYKDDPPHPFCFELKQAVKLEENKWHVVAERRYDD